MSESKNSNANISHRFHEMRPLYEKLADEVAFSLEKRLRGKKIPFAHVTKRTKTLDSFSDKLGRKHYDNPWTEITDFAGVRVVFLYPSHRGQIESLVEKEFKVVEKVDKLAALEDDQFGYGALHYIVHLSDATSGARYEDLKHLVCEIQVRTVMQDAWAIIDHHLVYKNEASIPSKFKRRLNTISGMFENIDDQFDRMRTEREAYVIEVKKQSETSESFLQQEINFETISAYLKMHFPDEEVANGVQHINMIIRGIDRLGYKTIGDVEAVLKRTKKARLRMSKNDALIFAIAEVARAVALVNPKFRKTGWDDDDLELFEENEHLVEAA